MKIPPDPRRATTSRPVSAAPSRPLAGPRSQPLDAPASQPRRLQLSGLIDDRIQWAAARERQRAWLVTTVILAQALITLMVVPGYLIPSANLPFLLTLGVALAFYLIAFFFNRVRRDARVAIFLLTGGGVLSSAAQVFVAALLTHDGARTAQSALLFLPIILEAGLFLTPELALMVASASAVITASAILLAMAIPGAASVQPGEAYLVMVYALGLEGFIGYLAWRLAQFIYETVKSAQADEDLRFAQARLDAAQRQIAEQRRQTMQDVGVIQMAVSSALAHEYDTRIDVTDSALAPLAASLSLLIQQLSATNALELKLQRMEAQAVPLVEMANRLANGAAPVLTSDLPTDSPFYAVIAALNQAQTINARRQARLQEAAAGIVGSLKHNREGFASTPLESAQAQQLAGQLVALVANLSATAQRQGESLAQARRALALVLPAEMTQVDLADPALREPGVRESEGLSDLEGLGADIGVMRSGYTEEMDALAPIDAEATGIPPLTTPLRAISALPADERTTDEAAATAGVDLPAGLGDAWLLLSHLHAQTVAEARLVSNIMRDLGVLARYVRRTGVGVDWIKQAMQATEVDAERLLHLTSASGVSLDLADDAGLGSASFGPRPAPASTPRRAPLVTRPLEGDMRLPADADMSSLQGSAAPPSGPLPGSIRTADLIGFAPFGGQVSDPAAPAPSDAQTEPTDDADPSSR